MRPASSTLTGLPHSSIEATCHPMHRPARMHICSERGPPASTRHYNRHPLTQASSTASCTDREMKSRGPGYGRHRQPQLRCLQELPSCRPRHVLFYFGCSATVLEHPRSHAACTKVPAAGRWQHVTLLQTRLCSMLHRELHSMLQRQLGITPPKRALCRHAHAGAESTRPQHRCGDFRALADTRPGSSLVRFVQPS